MGITTLYQGNSNRFNWS